MKSYRRNIENSLQPCLFVLVCLTVFNQAYAIDTEFSGFASTGLGKTSKKGVNYFGYDNSWNHETDSTIGIQFDTTFSNKYSWTTQLVSRDHTTDTKMGKSPVVEWFYGTYRITPEWRLRYGRLRLPLYVHSDVLEVGYAYNWLRPNVSVYNPRLYPISNYDGADLTYNTKWQGWEVELLARHGKYEKNTEVPGAAINIETSPTMGLSITLGRDWATLRYKLSNTRTNITSKVLTGVSQSIAGSDDVNIQEIDRRIRIKNAKFVYQLLGVTMDWNEWVFDIELNNLQTNTDLTGDTKSYYVSAAYQFDSFTPYIAFGERQHQVTNSLADVIDRSYETTPAGPQNGGLDLARIVYRQLATQDQYEHVYTLGARYDIGMNWALKAEWLRIDPQRGTAGDLFLDGGTEIPDHVDIFAIAVDFIF